jgi:long-chain acyl-CoA synthetase
VVLGDKRKYCTAFIVPNMDNLKLFAEKGELSYTDEDDLLNKSEVYSLIRKEIDSVSVDLASYETIKEFKLLKDPFTIESGELTPTMKVKRNVVEQKYGNLIEAMYNKDENSN